MRLEFEKRKWSRTDKDSVTSGTKTAKILAATVPLEERLIMPEPQPISGSVQCPRVTVANTRKNPPAEPNVHGGENEPTKQAQSLPRRPLVLRERDGSRPAAEV